MTSAPVSPSPTSLSSQSFASLPLSAAVLDNLRELGYDNMTPIQAESLPALLAGRDVIAQAKTGSGKTAAFGISALNNLDPRLFAIQALVLCPTRELADQVMQELRRLARALGNIKILSLCGGVSIGPQIGSLEHGAHVVVGTPGRVLKHLQKETLTLNRVNTFVLDEADRMLDMGFYDSILAVNEQLPKRRQTLLFSATYSEEIRGLSGRFQNDPLEVTVESVHTETQIEQQFFEVADKNRVSAVGNLLRAFVFNNSTNASDEKEKQKSEEKSALLFCNTKQRCDEVTQTLRAQGFHVAALHGDLEQRDRDQVLAQFSNMSCPLLVATDVAARGLDIKDLTAVINVELAFDPEVHVHRIGRTGRAGQVGLALSLCAPAEAHRALAIEEYLKQPMNWQTLPSTKSSSTIPVPAWVTLQISGGRKDKLRPGDILGALTGEGGIAGTQVGKIAIADLHAYVAVTRDAASAAIQRIEKDGIKAKPFKIRRL
ncbi:MAG: srmB [Verrucomicrobiaceae bacterium]|nr:srmB [Verrucomicrobiaceae bacterium]